MTHTATERRNVGDTVWFKGDEYTITTSPYRYLGGWWQDAKREDGKVVTIKWTHPS